MVMSEDLSQFIPKQRDAKLQLVEMLFNTEIKNRLDSIPEPFHTYYQKVKKWTARYPDADFDQLSLPIGLQSSINTVKTKLSQLKIGGLKEEYGYSSGSKFK